MAIRTLEIASGAGGRVQVGLRYDDATLEIASIGAVNDTAREATVTILHVPSGVSRFRTIPAGFRGTRSLPDQWVVALGEREGLAIDDLAIQVAFWAGA